MKIKDNWDLIFCKHSIIPVNFDRVGHSLIGFLCELLVFLRKNKTNNKQMSDLLKKNLAIRSFTHFWWATWANRSWSLIFDKQCEWIPYNRSFVLSDLIELLTVAYLIWAIWANERIPNPELWSSGQLFKVFLNGIDIAKGVYTVQCVHSRIWPKIVKQTNLSKKQQP